MDWIGAGSKGTDSSEHDYNSEVIFSFCKNLIVLSFIIREMEQIVLPL
jgi:hypothetical protein